MVTTAPLAVRAIAWTQFEPPDDVDWSTDADGGQALAEFAGRACYQSWSKPNPATATNAGYLAHILDVGHYSVLEHGTVTFYLTGVSRSFTHELVRHRHFSYSQLSQRYVDGRDAAMVEPDVIAADPYLHDRFVAATQAARLAYEELVFELDRRLEEAAMVCPTCSGPVTHEGNPKDTCSWRCPACNKYLLRVDVTGSPTARRKQARQAARSVLPNATETRIVVTGNYRAWRHFVDLRATEHADVEIRAVAVAVLRELQRVAPNVFADYQIVRLPDGAEIAASAHGERS